jgi:hypothetical protein
MRPRRLQAMAERVLVAVEENGSEMLIVIGVVLGDFEIFPNFE